MNRAYLLLFLALLSVSVSKGQGFDPPPLLSLSLLLPYNPIEILIQFSKSLMIVFLISNAMSILSFTERK